MSPDAKRLIREPLRRLDPVDKTDLIVFLVCTHLVMLLAGYLWGHR